MEGKKKTLLFFSVSSKVPFNSLKFTCIFYCDKDRGGEELIHQETMRHFYKKKKISLAKAIYQKNKVELMWNAPHMYLFTLNWRLQKKKKRGGALLIISIHLKILINLSRNQHEAKG